MGKKGRRFINKNDPSTITFNLVSTAQNDPRNVQALHTAATADEVAEADHTVAIGAPIPAMSALRRFVPRNAARRGKVQPGLPEVLRNILEPEHFVALSEEVYGDITAFPDKLKQKIELAAPAAEQTGSRAAGAELETKLDPDLLENADCYFPLDGYNYDQHLGIVTGPLIPAVPVTTAPQAVSSRVVHGGKVSNAVLFEEQEVIAALENVEEYEALTDDFLTDVLDGVNEKELLWGATSMKQDDEASCIGAMGRSSAEKQHIDQLLREARQMCGDSSDDGEEPIVGDQTTYTTDAQLLKMLEEEYNEDETGELEEEPISDAKTISEYNTLLDDFLMKQERKLFFPTASTKEGPLLEGVRFQRPEDEYQAMVPLETCEAEKILGIAEQLEKEYQEIATDDLSEDDSEPEKEQWDCETILTTRSNLYNHPGRISRPGGPRNKGPLSAAVVGNILRARTVDSVLQAAQLSAAASKCTDLAITMPSIAEGDEVLQQQADGLDSERDEEVIQLPSIITKRPKNEDKEEKRARKNAVKEARRLIRLVKKQNAVILKEEAKQQTKVAQSKNVHDIREGIRHFRI